MNTSKFTLILCTIFLCNPIFADKQPKKMSDFDKCEKDIEKYEEKKFTELPALLQDLAGSYRVVKQFKKYNEKPNIMDLIKKDRNSSKFSAESFFNAGGKRGIKVFHISFGDQSHESCGKMRPCDYFNSAHPLPVFILGGAAPFHFQIDFLVNDLKVSGKSVEGVQLGKNPARKLKIEKIDNNYILVSWLGVEHHSHKQGKLLAQRGDGNSNKHNLKTWYASTGSRNHCEKIYSSSRK